MFKDRHGPGFLNVTAFTATLSKPLVDFVVVRVRVASYTVLLREAELVKWFSRFVCGFDMTLITGYRQMGANQRKTS